MTNRGQWRREIAARPIGRELNRSHSTVLRELKRNALVVNKHGDYITRASQTQEPTRQRRRAGSSSKRPGASSDECRVTCCVLNDCYGKFQVETYKSPCEVLLSGEGDCSRKITRIASLLEQLGEEYIYLVDYKPRRARGGGENHIAIGVPFGALPSENGISTLRIGGKPYLLIELTATGFQIGLTQLAKGDTMCRMTHVLVPGEERLTPLSRN